jgi:hypothetical protein
MWAQTLDHFNFQVKQSFGQNYYVNDQYWNGTGPIFCTSARDSRARTHARTHTHIQTSLRRG